MKNGMISISLSLFLALILFGNLSCGKPEKEVIKGEAIEGKAPDFMLMDLEGNEVRLSDYKDKMVLLVFGATWCPYCRAEIPHLKELYSEYKDKELEILSIDILESREKVSDFAQEHNLPYRVLLDRDGKVAKLYRVLGVPTKILINKDGMIVCRECRSVDVLLKQEIG